MEQLPGPSQDDELHMSFFEHLDELRSRLIRSLIPFIPAFIAAWIYREELFSLMVIPLNSAWQSATEVAIDEHLPFYDLPDEDGDWVPLMPDISDLL